MKDNLKKLIFIHRGIYNNLNIPENSLRAFRKAIIENMNIELDIQLTKDNKLIVFHDYNLIRMTGKNKLIKNCTYDELKDLKLLKTNEKIPLFKEVLELVDGKVIINIEIKNTNKKKTTLKILSNLLSKYKGKFIIQSFYSKYLILINKYYKNYTKGLLITTPEIILDHIIDNKINLKLIKPDFLSYNKELVKTKKVQKLKKKIPIFAWTIKSDKEKDKYLKLADSIIMNKK